MSRFGLLPLRFRGCPSTRAANGPVACGFQVIPVLWWYKQANRGFPKLTVNLLHWLSILLKACLINLRELLTLQPSSTSLSLNVFFQRRLSFTRLH